MGDAVGGTEEKIGFYSTSHECITACLAMKKTKPDINGVTMLADLKGDCYCETNSNSVLLNSNWKTCKLIGNKCKVLLNLALYPTILEYSILKNREHFFSF